MDIIDAPRVQYDVETMRINVTFRGRRVSIPGKYETIEDGRQAADDYVRRYMTAHRD
jgi:hypothetical protein